MEKTTRSFNTVKNSHRDARKKRHQQERKVLLAIFSVVALILLTLAVFLVSSLVQVIVESISNGNSTLPPDNSQNDPVTLTYEQKLQERDRFSIGL